MDSKQLENKIGFQIAFLLYSGLSQKEVILNLREIAEDFANDKIQKICDSANIEKIRASKSDAEARRLLKEHLTNKTKWKI